MKRNIEWKEKLDGGVKRTVRISFLGKGKIKWQFKRSDEEQWDYDTPPSSEDLKNLEEKIDSLYHRRRATFSDLQMIQALRKKHDQI